MTASIRWLDELGLGDVASVGGKNASLGEMLRNLGSQGIKFLLALPRPPTPIGASPTPIASDP